MSAYKLIKVVKTTEKETQSLYDFEDTKTALDTMHNDYGVAVKADDTLCVYCTVINNETGELVGNLNWTGQPYPQDEQKTIRQRVYTHNDYQDDNITPYDSEKLAIGNFHTKWASYSKKEDCNFALVIRLDEWGLITDCLIKNNIGGLHEQL